MPSRAPSELMIGEGLKNLQKMCKKLKNLKKKSKKIWQIFKKFLNIF